jgi:hypothetical protein
VVKIPRTHPSAIATRLFPTPWNDPKDLSKLHITRISCNGLAKRKPSPLTEATEKPRVAQKAPVN